MSEQPIPVFIRIECPTCGRKSVAEQGKQVICESCVNDFLARNVGLMRPVVTVPLKPEHVTHDGELIPKED